MKKISLNQLKTLLKESDEQSPADARKEINSIFKSPEVQQIISSYESNDVHCLYDDEHRQLMMYAPLDVEKLWEDGYEEKLNATKKEMKNLVAELDEQTNLKFSIDVMLNAGELDIVFSPHEIIPWINNKFSHNKWYFRKTGKDWDIGKFMKEGYKYFLFGDIYIKGLK